MNELLAGHRERQFRDFDQAKGKPDVLRDAKRYDAVQAGVHKLLQIAPTGCGTVDEAFQVGKDLTGFREGYTGEIVAGFGLATDEPEQIGCFPLMDPGPLGEPVGLSLGVQRRWRRPSRRG